MGGEKLIFHRWIRFRTIWVATTLGVAVAVCSSGQAAVGAKSAVASSSKCGSVSYTAMPKGNADLASLPANVKDGYSGYYFTVNKSRLSDFKAKKGPYVIGYSDYFLGNSFHQDEETDLKADVGNSTYKKYVKKLITTNSNFNNSLQIQQIEGLISDHVSAIVAQPNSPTGYNAVIKKAYEAGIPFITSESYVTSPYAINVDNNAFLSGEKTAAKLATLIHGKGSVLIVDGITGQPANTAYHAGYLAAFGKCPGIKVIGTVEGQWSDTVAKSAVLQFLATHAADKIDAVMGAGGESVGIIQAFQQSGRSLVPMGDANPDEGGLVALKKYLPNDYAAGTDPPNPTITATLQVALRVLKGQGPRYNVMTWEPSAVSGKSVIDSWAQSGWQESSVESAPAPSGVQWFPISQLGAFFEKPGSL